MSDEKNTGYSAANVAFENAASELPAYGNVVFENAAYVSAAPANVASANVASETDSESVERWIRIGAIVVIVASLYGLLLLHGIDLKALGEIFLCALIGAAARVVVALSPATTRLSMVGPAVESSATASFDERAVQDTGTHTILGPAAAALSAGYRDYFTQARQEAEPVAQMPRDLGR